MRTNIILYLIILLFASSCMKDELAISKHDSGDITTATVNMEASYKWQIYYDLKTNTIVGQNLKTAWDLGFETGSTGSNVVLNSSKTMYAFNTGYSDFDLVTDTIGFGNHKKWDAPSGSYDSTAIGNWQELNPVYIIDRGYDEMGNFLGFRKIQILSVDDSKYVVRFSQLNGSGDTTLDILKDNNYNQTFLSFSISSILIVEPPKDKWDLVFTQYTHVFYNPLQTYLVMGCLQNRFNTTTAIDSLSTFNDITYENTSNYDFSNDVDAIGYGWKSFDGSSYVTNTYLNYIIRDQEGYFYKLHFIDFYNENGVKGNPKWELQQM